MNTHTSTTPETVNARLTLDVTYLLNGEAAPEMLARLQRMCERAIGEGLLTGETAAEVDTWSIDVSEVPSAADHETLEAEIAAFMQQRIKDGNLSAEDIPVRLARYGLMTSEAVTDEMRERLGMNGDDKAEGRADASSSTASADPGESDVQIAIACYNASGIPDFPVFTVRATPEEQSFGVHFDKARALAEEADYEKPFICLDAAEHGVLLSAARKVGLVPQVVVIDMTEGEIHSIRCDAGEIKVICYDTDEYSAAVADLPIGANGQLVRRWAHTQLAQVDSGLKLARR